MDLDSSILQQLDFGNTIDHSARTKIVNIVVISTTVTIVSIRTIIRLAIIRRLGIDDIIILFAALFQIGFSIEVLYALQFGLGKHIWLTATSLLSIIPHVRQIVQVLFFANMTYFTSVTLIKLSIIVCYIRVFPNKFMRWVCAIVGFLVLGVWMCSIFTTIFTCRKVSDQWEFNNVNRTCIAIVPYYYFAAAMNAFTDVALTVAPVPLLLTIKVSRREKFILCALFGMGLFAGACSIVRLLSLRNLYTVDISFGSSDTLDWSTIELGVGIFCASVPSLKPLLGSWARKETARSRARPSMGTNNRSIAVKGFDMLTAQDHPFTSPQSGYRAEIKATHQPPSYHHSRTSLSKQDDDIGRTSPDGQVFVVHTVETVETPRVPDWTLQRRPERRPERRWEWDEKEVGSGIETETGIGRRQEWDEKEIESGAGNGIGMAL